jgi:hypothetical protein
MAGLQCGIRQFESRRKNVAHKIIAIGYNCVWFHFSVQVMALEGRHDAVRLTMSHFQGIFIILLFMMTASAVAFSIEVYVHERELKKRRRLRGKN